MSRNSSSGRAYEECLAGRRSDSGGSCRLVSRRLARLATFSPPSAQVARRGTAMAKATGHAKNGVRTVGFWAGHRMAWQNERGRNFICNLASTARALHLELLERRGQGAGLKRRD